jgi:HEAT repeat protein
MVTAGFVSAFPFIGSARGTYRQERFYRHFTSQRRVDFYSSRSAMKLTILVCYAVFLAAHAALAREEWFRGLDLENALAQAELVMIARVTEVSETKIVFGGKGESTLQQFKFAPLRTLKGVFARDTLSLTSNDLGGFRFGETIAQMERGQVRLLILSRSSVGYANFNQLPSLDQSVPLLKDEHDPLAGAVDVLIAITQQRDRAKRVTRTLDGLHATRGAAAIPLLRSLERRALLVAQTPVALAAITPHLGDASPTVREQAALTLRAVLDADYLNQRKLHDGAASATLALLDRADPDIAARVAAIGVLGSLGEIPADNKIALTWLQIEQPSTTFAESSARLRAIAQLKRVAQRDAVLALFHHLPLDAPHDLGRAAGLAFIGVAPDQAARELGVRFNNKLAAGLDGQTEIGLLGELPAASAVPALLVLMHDSLTRDERRELVMACERVVEKTPDARLIPVLADALDPRQYELRWHAIDALRTINTDAAAQALQPRLREEQDLFRKLQIAEFLGRHQMRDGYAYAIEHMSEPSLREQAVAALGAIDEPKAVDALRNILKTSNDTAWNSAAIRALGRLKDKEVTRLCLQIVQDLKDPLAPSALIALGDLGEVNALANVRAAFESRKDDVVTAGVRAAGKLLALPNVTADDLRDRIEALFADADASQGSRAAALDALLALNDARLNNALAVAVRDAGLEGSDLLRRIEKLLSERKLPLVLR